MVEFVLKRPVFITIIYFLLIVLGIFAVKNIKINLLPEISGPKIIVSTDWPYTSPKTIEMKITAPIEEMAWKLPEVKNTVSRSAYGSSTVEIELNKKANVRFAEFLIKEEISELKKKLPYGVFGPYVLRSIPEELKERNKDFFSFQVIAPMGVQRLREFTTKNITPLISAIYGVSTVKIYGGSEPVIKIILYKEKMKQTGITLNQVLEAIRALSLPPVSVSIEKQNEKNIVIVGKIDVQLKEIENLPLSVKGKRIITLSRIAGVYRGYGMLYSLSRVNGMDAVTVTIDKNRDANAVEISEKINKKLDQLKKRFPFLRFKIIEDSGKEIKKEINNLIVKAGYIFLCVLLSLVIFLFSIRTPLIVVLSILFSSLFTIDFFFLFGISVNLITLTGLALGFGMIVDNSIVVGESIIDYLKEGYSRKDAVIRGTNNVVGSVLASTLTTIGVFFAFVFLSGRMATYYKPLAYSVVIALLSSMFIAFTLIPLLFFYTNAGSKKSFLIRFEFMKKPLQFLTRAWLPMVILFAYIFNYSYVKFRDEVTKGRFGWEIENNTLYLAIRMPGETEISTIVDIMTPIEREVLKSKAIKEEVLTIYKKGAYLIIKFKDKYKNSFAPLALKSKLIGLVSPLAGITVSVYGIDDKSYYSSPGGIGGYYSSQVKISGFVFEKVQQLAEYVKKLALKNSKRVRKAVISYDRRFWYRGDKKEYVIVFKKEFIAKHNINIGELLSFISANLKTQYSFRVKFQGDEIPLDIRFYGNKTFTPDNFYNLLFKTGKGTFKLKEILKIEERKIGTAIVKENQKYTAKIMWNYIGSYKGSQRYLNKVFNKIELPPGYTKSKGSNFMTKKETKMVYKGYLIALIILYLILASYFESFYYPFIVMLSIPFSLVGIFLIFWLGNYSFDSAAYIALILIFGVVVNDAILYVDYYRKHAEKIAELASIKRIRAMLLTTLTTIAGMFPLIIHKGGEINNQNVWQSLGIATIGGLTASTFFTIFFLPSFIKLAEYLKNLLLIIMSSLITGIKQNLNITNTKKNEDSHPF